MIIPASSSSGNHSGRRPVNQRVVSWSKEILLGLLAVSGETIDIVLSMPYKGGRLFPGRHGYYQAYYQLERAGYIKRSKTVSSGYTLTKHGRRRALELLLRSQPRHVKPWDGKWRVVVFDVPERRRAARDFLRRQLKLLGFRQLHKSVWVSPYDLSSTFREFLREAGVLTSSRVMVVESMDYDRDLRQQFGFFDGSKGTVGTHKNSRS